MTVVRDRDERFVQIDGRSVRLTHLDRILWPVTGATKRDLLGYYQAIAPVLLPHVRGRATMLWRFPEGIDGPGWFQAECRSRPDWVRTHEILGSRGQRLRYCLIEEPATLAGLANLGTIELHPHNWTVDRPTEPSGLVFDLDPGPPAGLAECARVALEIGARLRADGLASRVKTSGGLGLHVVARLARGHGFSRVKAYARRLADALATDRPDLVLASNNRSERTGRVYVDWIQNDPNRQMVAAYSLRAMPIPQVSTPLTWAEVEAAADGSVAPLRPGPRQILERVERLGDLWTWSPDDAVIPDG
jgi:bifunctional non-homologous end joining protein LigD